MPWNGDERRHKANVDHDTLIELVQILTNHVKNFDNHVKTFTEHVVDDKTNYENLRTDNLKLKQCIWVATGIVVGVQAIPLITNIIKILK